MRGALNYQDDFEFMSEKDFWNSHRAFRKREHCNCNPDEGSCGQERHGRQCESGKQKFIDERMMKMEKCGLCAKECSLDNLRCKKGKEFYIHGNADCHDDAKFTCNDSMGAHVCKLADRQEEYCEHEVADNCGHKGRHGRFGGRGRQAEFREGRFRDCGFDPDRGLAYLLSFCFRLMNNRMPQQGKIRHILGRCGNMSQKDLQERLGVKAGSISEIINKMERKGIIERRVDPGDRRRRRLFLGANAATDNYESDNNDFFSVLSEDEQALLKNLLIKLCEGQR